MREAASFIATQTRPAPFGVLSAVLDDLVTAFRSWRNRRTLTTLAEFDDHLLADMGISREDVEHALNLPFAEDASLHLQRIALQNRSLGWRQ